MTKYKVPQAVMGELDECKDNNEVITITDLLYGISYGSKGLRNWITKPNDNVDTRKREQAVIDYVFNGADNFEVKAPTWVIVSKKMSDHEHYHFLFEDTTHNMKRWRSSWGIEKDDAINNATRITDPKLKDALLYANKDFEAIEVEE